MDQAPWKVNDNLSYGFATYNNNASCGKCFQIKFTNTSISGKTMIVMINNISSDTGPRHFDIMIPGGGLDEFNAFSRQLSQNGVSNVDLGSIYGGFRAKCGDDKECVRSMCNQNFGTPALSDLKSGCDWYVDWFDIADNPDVQFKEIDCPSELVSKYKFN